MEKKPKINPAAIDLLTRVYNSHKKGLPEWMKNAREAYLRKNIEKENRSIVINYRDGKAPKSTWLECIDFAGISGNEIESRYLEWANPDAALAGLKAGEAEGGQGNGGKAYLREMFQTGYFISICGGKLSVVSFVDEKKYILDFVPDEKAGKDTNGDSPALPEIRNYTSEWLEAYGLPPEGNITIVRGIGPNKPIDPNRLLEEIQQFPQARETIRACSVHFYIDRIFRRKLATVEPSLHPAYPNAIKISIPAILPHGNSKVSTARPPEFPPGELELRVSAKPLHGQALSSWNRIDFHGKGISVIAWKKAEELPLQFPQFSRHLFGRCTLPLLGDPGDNYELQGRIHLKDGPLSDALFEFIGEEADKILKQLATQVAGTVEIKKRKNLEKLNQHLANWIESKLSTLHGLAETGSETGVGKPVREKTQKKEHEPPAKLVVHRQKVEICRGVSYRMRAIAYDAMNRPVPAGKVVWKSNNPKVIAIHPENGTIHARDVGLTVVTVNSETGQLNASTTVQVQDAIEVQIKNPSPINVGSNRRIQLVPEVKTSAGKTLKDIVVSWRSSDEHIVTVGPDGWLVGGEVGETEVVAHVGLLESNSLDVIVEKGAAGKPKGGGKGKPRILLSGVDNCPFDNTRIFLEPTDPPVYQRPFKPDYENNVFWINLQHPLAAELLKMGEASVQWRTYHFQRLVDVYTMVEMRSKFRDDENLDVDQVLEEIHTMMAELYASAKDEVFEILYDEIMDLGKLGTA